MTLLDRGIEIAMTVVLIVGGYQFYFWAQRRDREAQARGRASARARAEAAWDRLRAVATPLALRRHPRVG
jgi:hypothetical protein